MMVVQHEWEMEHVPHSIYIQPLRTYDVWPFNPNNPITPPFVQEINTFDDWRVVPISRPVIAPPVFKENYLDIPATYGSLDYSRAHTGLPVYGNRTGSWEFVVLNDYRRWEEAYSDIQHTIHGKRCFVTLEDDLDYFYVGNLTLNEWRSDPGWSRIVINYNLEPYKYSKTKSEHVVNLTDDGNENLTLTPILLGRAPTWPWVKVEPNDPTQDANVELIYGNNELTNINSIVITEKNKYVQIPDFILSNESGSNNVGINLYSEKGAKVTLAFYRGYM